MPIRTIHARHPAANKKHLDFWFTCKIFFLEHTGRRGVTSNTLVMLPPWCMYTGQKKG